MQTALNVGAGVLVTSVYEMMDRADNPQGQAFTSPPYDPPSRTLPQPATQTAARPAPSMPRRITRRPSWDLPLCDYVARCCNDIIGLEGSPGINNHQANEQVFSLQQRVIKALEQPDEDGFVDDRQLRREAAHLRARYSGDVERAKQAARR